MLIALIAVLPRRPAAESPRTTADSELRPVRV